MALPTHTIDEIGATTYFGPDKPMMHFAADLNALDGDEWYAQILTRLPHPGWSEDFTSESRVTGLFMQAGGSATGMTVEVRTGAGDQAALYKVGRAPVHDTSAAPHVPITVGPHINYVYDNEVFDAGEAAALFFHYYRHDTVPDGYVLRDMNFS